MKFSPLANNHIVELLESEGARGSDAGFDGFPAVFPSTTATLSQTPGRQKSTARLYNPGICLVGIFSQTATEGTGRPVCILRPPSSIREAGQRWPKAYVSLGQPDRRGMVPDRRNAGADSQRRKHIICTQPFGCLPNHIVGKGVIKELRRNYPLSNIIAVDYDPGASQK